MLYSNHAFKDIVQTRDAEQGIELPLLKLKTEEGIDESVIKGLFLDEKPLFSIRNLVMEGHELARNMVFSIERASDSLNLDNNVRSSWLTIPAESR